MRFTEIGSPHVTEVQREKADDGRVNALNSSTVVVQKDWKKWNDEHKANVAYAASRSDKFKYSGAGTRAEGDQWASGTHDVPVSHIREYRKAVNAGHISQDEHQANVDRGSAAFTK